MRLLNCKNMQMKEFFDSDIPSYAILSHTWGDDEVSYQDFRDGSYLEEGSGFTKIRGFCAKVSLDWGHLISWVWIDTCCIDKSSSAELSEAINSMFRWYRRSSMCFAYLSDVEYSGSLDDENLAFRYSRWHTRGWTLQELLAPRVMQFCDKSWNTIGDKYTLAGTIAEVTNIPIQFLRRGQSVHEATIAQRISWASARVTSRKEDMAYCLLGLLDINMPLLYGEGDKAFIRLQEELVRTTYDHTILAWGLNCPMPRISYPALPFPTCFANSPAAFRAWDPEITSIIGGKHYSQTNLGIYIDLRITKFENYKNMGLAFLDCGPVGRDPSQVVGLPLELHELPTGVVLATRAYSNAPFLVPLKSDCSRTPVYLPLKRWQPPSGLAFNVAIELAPFIDLGYYLADFFPTPSITYPSITNRAEDSLVFKDEVNCQRLFRLCHPSYTTILLFIEPTHSDLHPEIKAELRVAPTTRTLTSWHLLIEPDFDRVGFDELYKSVSWTLRGHLTSSNDWVYTGELSIDKDEIVALSSVV
ncbi:HET-domain-containing protein [Daldinia decipiens]|uniref:HET-domain-containing protein n=1 Tax=Daldinia decipiens TaxID=326647 RepID=UPI0020C449CA|nr:HET-domain-containing protein [Daldinia decipiens]KAI1654362.1 HET-domain-containing protein [Daldinia decipiens]